MVEVERGLEGVLIISKRRERERETSFRRVTSDYRSLFTVFAVFLVKLLVCFLKCTLMKTWRRKGWGMEGARTSSIKSFRLDLKVEGRLLVLTPSAIK